MDVELHTNGMPDEVDFKVEDEVDEVAFENERCGICLDPVIDRGVLDCCNHWFCFVCIDNWATITNLCPLCKSEFQLITCIPVYDTIGSFIDEGHSVSRGDDWCIQGKNNTLSFPSYYIDEDAVVCLEGGGCKVRSGHATAEEDLTLDTSIACDSCDIWYHAFCVGFDQENASESSWLCPRCKTDEVPPNKGATKQCGQDAVNPECLIGDAFSGKVSVSVADAWETALVVSMVEEKESTGGSQNLPEEIGLGVNQEKRTGTSPSKLNAISAISEMKLRDEIDCTELLNNSFVSDKNKMANAFTQASQENNKMPFHIEETTCPRINVQETSLSLSLSRDASLFSPCEPLLLSDFMSNSTGEAKYTPSSSDGFKVLSSLSFESSHIENRRPSGSETNIDLCLGLTMGSCLLVDKTVRDANETEAVKDIDQKDLEFTGVKRECAEKARDDVRMDDYADEHREVPTETDMENEVPTKKAKSGGPSELIPLKRRTETTFKGRSLLGVVSKDKKLKPIPENNSVTPNVMSIVRGTDRRSLKASAYDSTTEKSAKERENSSGLRIKKIMRRDAEGNDSSILVQKIRKEIRESLSDRALKGSDKKEPFDVKLLTAFRAAIARPNNAPSQKIDSSIVRTKRSILQKGKSRESLTKKLYGTASGRRRRAWDRDWEIEFWKYRCRRTKPEKVETLKSVLELLKTSSASCSEGSKVEKEIEGKGANPILSRLYLADASVFPRKEDIKPVSDLMGLTKTSNLEKNKENNLKSASDEISKPRVEVSTVKNAKQSSISPSSNSGGNTHLVKEKPGKSDVTSDKRKWALEVLARKTGIIDRDANRGKQEESTELKRSYPLLAQLPADMRPILTPVRNSKVLISVRQAQLNRLIEHYLKKTDLAVIRRTADTELAIADAVNVEKEIYERSNSKLVYVNLCSQMLSQRAPSYKKLRTETVSSDPMPAQGKDLELETKVAPSNSEATNGEDVEEALKRAGLVSDSPPDSPYQLSKDLNEDDEETHQIKVRNDTLDNIFDLDSHPELDIFGDFEYALEDEEYIGLSSTARGSKASDLQTEDGDLKIKVVLSTLNCEKPFALATEDATLRHQNSENEAFIAATEDREKLDIIGAQNDSLSSSPSYKDNILVKRDNPCVLSDAACGEGDKEPTLAECEELYGPDNESPETMVFNDEPCKPNECVEKEATAENIVPDEKENSRASMAGEDESESCAGESCAENNLIGCGSSRGQNSPTHSLTSENIPRNDLGSNNGKQSDLSRSIFKKVEAYIKEHIRPLCKSGVITTEQYRWAVMKTADKVMKYHSRAKNANFLIKEGHKVKKLAEQYVQTAQLKKERLSPLS